MTISPPRLSLQSYQILVAFALLACSAHAFICIPTVPTFATAGTSIRQRSPLIDDNNSCIRTRLSLAVEGGDSSTLATAFDQSVSNRYAATRYERYDETYDNDSKPSSQKVGSPANPQRLGLAKQALELACRAPTGFNVQPYKLLLVESPSAKQALAKYCIGRNRDRVLDSDCSVVFLADRESMRTWKQYRTMLESNPSSKHKTKKSFRGWLKLRGLTGLFSSGLPLPKVIGGPISFGIRLAMRVISWFVRARLVVPTLSSPECWSQKNTMLVAMTYMLGCSSRGLDTTPMEGFLSWGIRRSLKIPRRYTIPLVVSTGKALHKKESDDAGMGHGNTAETATPRFSIEDTIYVNGFP